MFVSAGNCGGCIRFKQNFWDKTKAELAKISGLRVVDLAINKLGDPLPPDTHRDLSRFVAWYPTFILISKASYEKARLEGVVFNGSENPQQKKWELVAPAQRRAIDDVALVGWVKEQLATNSLFKRGVTFEPLVGRGILKGSKGGKDPDSDESDGEYYTSGYCQQAFVPFT